ncbi:MAG: hypothetical protein PHE89_04135 [Alphaproteobacteria bacterium]|nr:hypothetical protein [Alphaproteobacteria bacterium]
MTHPRQHIREAVATRLHKIFENVYASRAKPLFDQDLPAILVYASSEGVKQERWDTDGFGALTRELELFVEAVDTGKDDLDDKLDTLAEKIEAALDGWEIPDRKSAVLRFKGTDTDMSIEGNKTYGAVRLAFSLTYQTATKNDD